MMAILTRDGINYRHSLLLSSPPLKRKTALMMTTIIGLVIIEETEHILRITRRWGGVNTPPRLLTRHESATTAAPGARHTYRRFHFASRQFCFNGAVCRRTSSSESRGFLAMALRPILIDNAIITTSLVHAQALNIRHFPSFQVAVLCAANASPMLWDYNAMAWWGNSGAIYTLYLRRRYDAFSKWRMLASLLYDISTGIEGQY